MFGRRRAILVVAILIVVALAGAVTYLVLTSAPSHAPSRTYVAPAICPTLAGGAAAGNWTTYHQDNARTGAEPTTSPIRSVSAIWGGPVTLDGQVYAEPLVCGNAVFVATENNSVYAINATSGGLLWRTNFGPPVSGSSLPCGDIDPSGITGTPVINATSGILYAVAFLVPAHHVLFGLNVRNGSIVSQVGVDPTGAIPSVEQERGALALANGMVYVPYGGLAGDCGQYHGWVVGVPVSGAGGLLAYQVPTQREGGIWSPAGISFAPDGDLYVSTGNGASDTTFDHGDSVIELTPTLTEVGYFAPTNWVQLNDDDTDLGSVAPTVLPGGQVFQIGKAGVGYVLSGTQLGGIGAQLGEGGVCAGAYGGTARVGSMLLVPCVNGLYQVTANTTNFTVGWHSSDFDAGSPIITGDVAWVFNISTPGLLGLNASTGAPLFSFALGAVDHFCSPAASPGGLYAAGGDELYGFAFD